MKVIYENGNMWKIYSGTREIRKKQNITKDNKNG